MCLGDPAQICGENKDVFSWTASISGLVKQNRHQDAIDVFKLMLMNEQRLNYVTVLSVLRAVSALSKESMISGIHGTIIKMGFELEVSVVTALIGAYANCDLLSAWKIFTDMPIKDLVMWSAMVSMSVKNGEYTKAIELFKQMLSEGIEPNAVTIVSILPACAKLQALPFGKEVHVFAMKSAFYTENNVQNSLIDMYAKCGHLNYAAQVFAAVQMRDLVTWKTMIRGLIENDYPRKALVVFSEMQQYFSTVDDAVVCDMIGASSDAEELIFGLGLHCCSIKSGSSCSISVGTTLMQMYSKFGLVDKARLLFDQLHPKDLISWSAMISAYAQNGYASDALGTFKQLQSANERPNEITFVSLLQACSLSGTQELGESIHGCVTKSGYLPNTFLASALIDLYCKFGRIKQGRAMFNDSPVKDLICWSSLIHGYGLNGRGDDALETFSNMLDSGMLPNDVVFVSVLSACSHCGLEDDGWYWFYRMQEEYGIKPKLAHYACMVDLLSRQGNVEEALNFVYNMAVEPDKRIWGSLLAGCRATRGSVEVAEQVAKRLIALDPNNCSYYVFLSNLYAQEGRWDDVKRVREMIDEKRTGKTKGYSTF